MVHVSIHQWSYVSLPLFQFFFSPCIAVVVSASIKMMGDKSIRHFDGLFESLFLRRGQPAYLFFGAGGHRYCDGHIIVRSRSRIGDGHLTEEQHRAEERILDELVQAVCVKSKPFPTGAQ